VRDLFGGTAENEQQQTDGVEFSATVLQGRYAEFMVCAYLTQMGHVAHHLDVTGFDVILEYEGLTIRVQVKSTTRVTHGPFKSSVRWDVGRGSRYGGGHKKHPSKGLLPRDADIAALFYAPLQAVVFYPILKCLHSITLPLSFVRNSKRGEVSLGAAINKWKKNRKWGEVSDENRFEAGGCAQQKNLRKPVFEVCDDDDEPTG